MDIIHTRLHEYFICFSIQTTSPGSSHNDDPDDDEEIVSVGSASASEDIEEDVDERHKILNNRGDSEHENLLPVKKRKISQEVLQTSREVLQTCGKYLSSVSGVRTFLKKELQHFNINNKSENEDDPLPHAHQVYTQIFTLRREIELKKIQLEIRLLDYESMYRGVGFKLTDVYKRRPELVRDCTCSVNNTFCRFHSGADTIFTNVYEPHYIERAGSTFVIVDLITEMVQICVPSGHWLSFYSNQILAIAWHLYYLLIPELSKPLAITIPLGDGYSVKFKKNGAHPWFAFTDQEGNSFEFKGYQAVSILHTICIRFPDIQRSQFGRADIGIPCLFSHNTILQGSNSCTTCSTPIFNSN